MGILSKCLLRYKPRRLDTDGWFFTGFNARIDEYRRVLRFVHGGSDKITVGDKTVNVHWLLQNIADLEKQYYLFIGYAPDIEACFIHYPIYYDLRTGYVYIGRSSENWNYAFRNLELDPIYFSLEDSNLTELNLGLNDYHILLSDLKLSRKSEGLPCKILAKLDIGNPDDIHEGLATIAEDDYFLVACGISIVVATRREIEEQAEAGRINLIVGKKDDTPIITVVSLGQHNRSQGTRDLTYDELDGLIYDYSACSEIYAKGTLDCTPNVIINAFGVTGYHEFDRPVNLPCYRVVNLRDSKIPWSEFENSFGRGFFFNLVTFEPPKDIEYMDSFVELCKGTGADIYAQVNMAKLTLPDALKRLPQDLERITVDEIVIPEGITQVTFDSDLPFAGSTIIFKSPDIKFAVYPGGLVNYKTIICPEEAIPALETFIQNELLKGCSFRELFPRLAFVNDTPVIEFVAKLSAERLLHGLGTIVV